MIKLTSGLLLACLSTISFIVPSLAFAAEPSNVEELPALISHWTGLERQQTILRSNWRQEQAILEQQLYLLEKEQEELSSILANSVDMRDEVEVKRLELLEQQTSMEQQQGLLEQGLDETIIGIERIYTQLPPPLMADWQDSVPKLRSELISNSERLQLVVELLTQLDDFQRKISLHETTLTLTDNKQYLVRQVYLGLSQGWYISADGSRAGYGYITPEGWHWESSDSAATITQFLAILDGKQPAELLSLPLNLVSIERGQQ